MSYNCLQDEQTFDTFAIMTIFGSVFKSVENERHKNKVNPEEPENDYT